MRGAQVGGVPFVVPNSICRRHEARTLRTEIQLIVIEFGYRSRQMNSVPVVIRDPAALRRAGRFPPSRRSGLEYRRAGAELTPESAGAPLCVLHYCRVFPERNNCAAPVHCAAK